MQNRARHDTNLARRNLLALVSLAPILASAQTHTSESKQGARLPEELARAIDVYDKGTVQNDVKALAEVIADDYSLVNSDGSVQNKTEYLADFHLPGFKVEPYVIEEPILKVWKTLALTGGKLHLRWNQDGAKHERPLRIVHVWTRQDGRWRITYTQLTRILS